MPLRSPFSVQYLNTAAISRLASSNSLTILGVIGYGSDRPASLSQSCPFVRADLLPLGGAPLFETWCAPSGVSYHTSGAIHGASTDDLIFGVVELDRTSGISLQTGIANAYAGIFDFLRDHGFQAPLRFWNYLPKITIDEDGLERYRRFNIGRYDAFSARLLLPVPPVASAVGGQGGVPMIYFLGGRVPAKQLENPRQVSAFHYPPVYGPRSPQFSRASI
ncbi:MAG: uncharacterized protein JWM91_4481, partial [Rhodospirillales bacterium]|nr:uncharacterized protein [Rhodospirillales bacterium]